MYLLKLEYLIQIYICPKEIRQVRGLKKKNRCKPYVQYLNIIIANEQMCVGCWGVCVCVCFELYIFMHLVRLLT